MASTSPTGKLCPSEALVVCCRVAKLCSLQGQLFSMVSR